jgi:hypothetical protein
MVVRLRSKEPRYVAKSNKIAFKTTDARPAEIRHALFLFSIRFSLLSLGVLWHQGVFVSENKIK